MCVCVLVSGWLGDEGCHLFLCCSLPSGFRVHSSDDAALIEIVCTKSNEEIKEMKRAYSEMFDRRDLEKDIVSETGGRCVAPSPPHHVLNFYAKLSSLTRTTLRHVSDSSGCWCRASREIAPRQPR